MKKLLIVLGQIWLSPITLLGFLLALVGGVTFREFDRNLGVFHYYVDSQGLIDLFLTKGRFAGFTVGSVVFFRTEPLTRSESLVAHEHQHVRQGMVFGPFWTLVYCIASVISYCQGTGLYQGNWFEVNARQVAGESTKK